MPLNLSSRLARIVFVGAILAVALPLAFFSLRAWLAHYWGSSPDPALWHRAATLEPGDADYWSRLGLYKQWGMAQGGGPQAIGYLRHATEMNPRSAALWMDLADAYAGSGNVQEAQQAFERAQTDYPDSAEVGWRYGSFLLFQGDFRQGYSEIKRAVLVDPSLTASAIAECWQASPDVDALLNRALPAQSQYYLTATDFFLSQNLLDPALAVWNRELALDMHVRMPQAIPLVNALIGQYRLAEAEQTWQQALRASRWPRDTGDGSSLVFNGGFEHKIADGGFGWREIPADGVTYARDSNVSHSGSDSLRVDFGGKANLDFQNVFEFVPVEPRTRYHFSAYVRTEGISTDHGIRFQILDPQHPSEVQVFTPNMIGTNPWTLVEADFTTGKNTQLLEIALCRIFTWKFDNKIRGTAWVDDVVLSPIQTQAKGRPR